MISIRRRISTFLADLQQTLFPALAQVVPDLVTKEHERLAAILELVQIERVIAAPQTTARGGRPPLDRRKLARAYLVKAALGISESEDLYHRLETDRTLRRLCGWEEGVGLPSLSTFSRAFAEFAETRMLDRRHDELVTIHLGDSITEHVGYDTTAIPVRERVVKSKTKDASADTAAIAEARQPRKRGRRPAGVEPPPPPEPKCLQRQQTQTVAEMLAELPTACGVGCKKNSHGNKEWWIGYKFHVAQTDDGIPVAAFTTSATNLHDSQGAIPLLHLTQARVRSCYDLLDSAYDAKEIHAVSHGFGHVPIIDANVRRTGTKAERERLARLPHSQPKLDRALVDVDRRRRFGARTSVERFNSRLKDDCGARIIRVRGEAKVHAFLMCGLLVIFADALMALGGG